MGATTARAYMPQAKSTEHETPPDLFDALDQEFGPFTLDPAALPGQYTAEYIVARGGMAYCPPWVTAPTTSWREDGLRMKWAGRVFLNPPYGRAMPQWIERAVAMIEDGHSELALALIPSRTDTKMWQKFVVGQVGQSMSYANNAHYLIKVVRFLPGRLKFGGQTNPAPFPSAVVVWAR